MNDIQIGISKETSSIFIAFIRSRMPEPLEIKRVIGGFYYPDTGTTIIGYLPLHVNDKVDFMEKYTSEEAN